MEDQSARRAREKGSRHTNDLLRKLCTTLALSRALSQMIMTGMAHQQNGPNGRDSQNEAQSRHQSRALMEDSMQKLVIAAKLDTYRMTCKYIASRI